MVRRHQQVEDFYRQLSRRGLLLLCDNGSELRSYFTKKEALRCRKADIVSATQLTSMYAHWSKKEVTSVSPQEKQALGDFLRCE